MPADRTPSPLPQFDPELGRKYKPRRKRTGPLDIGDQSSVLGYVRVSTTEQAESGLGLTAQRDSIEAYCQARGWHLTDIIDDAGVSGSTPPDDRHLADALTTLRRGDNASALVVSKLDRLTRRTSDLATILDQADAQGWAVVAIGDGIDTSTGSGRLVANLMGAVAQFERDRIAERTAEALTAKRRKGERLGRPVTLPDNIRHRIAQQRHAGHSLRAIAQDLTDENVPTAQGGARWHASTVRATLASLELDAEVAHFRQLHGSEVSDTLGD